jgi:hypothetical protein
VRDEWARIGQLQGHLVGCAFAGMLIGMGGVAPLLVPAALVAARTFLHLAPLLDRPRARAAMQWAAIASGGIVVAGLLQLPPSSRDAALVASVLTISLTVSLYAVGLAAWTAGDGDGRLTRGLHGSVGVWWLGLATAGLAFHRTTGVVELVLTVGPALVALALLANGHRSIRSRLRQLAAAAGDERVRLG